MLRWGAGQLLTSVEKSFPNFNTAKEAVQPWASAFTSLSLFPYL